MGEVSLDYKIEQETVYALLDRVDIGFSSKAWAAFLVATMAPHLQQRASARFAGHGDDVVGQWAPLKASTERFRTQQGFPAARPINHRTGELERLLTQGMNFISAPVGPVAELTFPNLPSGELRDKLETAQKGKAKPSTVPRPVIGLGHTDLMFLLAAMGVYARKVTGDNGQ